MTVAGQGNAARAANTRWSLVEARTFAAPQFALEALAHRVLPQIVGECFREELPNRWRGELRRPPLSLFDDCEAVVTVEGDAVSSRVTVEAVFDVTGDHVGWVMFSAMTIVGIPLVFVWRATSVRASRKLARQVFDRVWDALGARDQSPYR